jgi:hypothetical protein
MLNYLNILQSLKFKKPVVIYQQKKSVFYQVNGYQHFKLHALINIALCYVKVKGLWFK